MFPGKQGGTFYERICIGCNESREEETHNFLEQICALILGKSGKALEGRG